MITPDEFRVNEAWIAARINDEFLYIGGEPYDIYCLVDAASCYVLGHVFSQVANEAPIEADVQDLFQAAWQAKSQWAEMLIITEDSPAEEVFLKQAKLNGMGVKKIPFDALEPILGPLKESFHLDFMGNRT